MRVEQILTVVLMPRQMELIDSIDGHRIDVAFGALNP